MYLTCPDHFCLEVAQCRAENRNLTFPLGLYRTVLMVCPSVERERCLWLNNFPFYGHILGGIGNKLILV